MRSRQIAERLGVEEAHMLEFQQFNMIWDRKMGKYVFICIYIYIYKYSYMRIYIYIYIYVYVGRRSTNARILTTYHDLG
jgi:hypothetical protein